jgi:hypothetical protein
MARKNKSVHEKLKQWLLELGRKKGYETYSGDSEPVDIRIKKKHIEYKPDVIWHWKGGLYIAEIAFSEDWRAIAGEFLLISMVKSCKGFLIITVGDPAFSRDLFQLIDRKLELPEWISYTFEESDLNDIKKMKKNLRSWLRENEWI